MLIILGWVALIFLAYKVSQYDTEMANFDPFEILGISAVSKKIFAIIVIWDEKQLFFFVGSVSRGNQKSLQEALSHSSS